jgi:hypothetical protein
MRSDLNDYATVQTEDRESTVRFEGLWRIGGRSYVNASIAGKRQDRFVTGITNSILPGCSINFNLLEFLFLRFDYEANVILDSTTTHLLSTKITGSF